MVTNIKETTEVYVYGKAQGGKCHGSHFLGYILGAGCIEGAFSFLALNEAQGGISRSNRVPG